MTKPLRFKGKNLNDNMKLGDYGIKEGDTLRDIDPASWLCHHLNATDFYPELISANMAEDLVSMLMHECPKLNTAK